VVLAADGAPSAAACSTCPAIDAAGRRRARDADRRPAADRIGPTDDVQAAEVEVVDRVTQVLLDGGRAVAANISSCERARTRQELRRRRAARHGRCRASRRTARRILDAFPPTAKALGEDDAIVAFDYDWRLLDAAARRRLERWVAEESGGLVLVAGGVFMEAWLADPQTGLVRAAPSGRVAPHRAKPPSTITAGPRGADAARD
jgi:hypothetical protein